MVDTAQMGSRVRPSRRLEPEEKSERIAERRAQLADAALQTLSELGYARTSLREIAQNSQFSHGVLHYYFADKMDLITHCVRRYKARCVSRYDEMLDTATTDQELRQDFAVRLAKNMLADAPGHRLWYDLRAQSLFEPSFRDDVAAIDRSLEQMIWRVVTRLAELGSTTPTVSSPVGYALFDGLFQHALRKHLSGDGNAAADLRINAHKVLGLLVPG